MFQSIKEGARKYWREDGNVTVEFVILFPVMLLVMGVTMDVAFMYYKKSQIQTAIQDVTRERSIGHIATNEQAATILREKLATQFTNEAIVTMSLRGALVSTSVDVPLHDMQLLGFFAGIVGDPNVNIGDQQFLESYDIAADDTDGGWKSVDTTMVEGILEDGTVADTTTTTTSVPGIIY